MKLMQTVSAAVLVMLGSAAGLAQERGGSGIAPSSASEPTEDPVELGGALSKLERSSAAALATGGKRRKSMEMLDGAHRLAAILKDAGYPGGAERFRRMSQARHMVQIGRPSNAVGILRDDARRSLGSGTSTTRKQIEQADSGKLVIDLEGREVGRIESIDLSTREVIEKKGGVLNLFGFWDYGNRLQRRQPRCFVPGKEYVVDLCSRAGAN